MRLIALVLTATAACISGVTADFWLSYLDRYAISAWVTKRYEGGTFNDKPDFTCDNATGSYKVWGGQKDVSGDKRGIRWVADRVGLPLYKDNIEMVEFNTLGEKPGHHTIYRARNYAMVDVDDRKTGQCYLNRSYTWELEECRPHSGTIVKMWGSSVFFCESDIGPTDL